MATLAIVTWDLFPLNPDGTDNTFLPSYNGSAPTNEQVDSLAMGQQVRLTMTFQLAGTLPDTSTAELSGTLVRYSPGLFVDWNSQFFPPLVFPDGGYSYTIPSNSPDIYTMRLMGQGGNLNANENGKVTIEVLTSTEFVIVHVFRLTSDVENYVKGFAYQNQYRLSKASQLSPGERDISRPSAYGWDKAINAFIGTKHLNAYNVFARELSLQFSGSFDGYDSSGIPSDYQATYKIERVLNPGVEETSLSPFEDNKIIVEFTDASAEIDTSEAEVILVNRNLTRNIADFTTDFQLQEAKLIASGGSAQLDGAIYEPVTYANSAGVTTITFILKGTELAKNQDYQIHVNVGVPDGPSANRMIHSLSGMLRTDGAPVEVDFDFDVQNWTRNGNHAQNFTVTVMERVTSTLSMNKDEYDANAAAPFSTFDDDIDTITVRIIGDNSEIILQELIQKQADGSWIDTEFIGIIQTASDPSNPAMFHAYLKEFRVPYPNNQELPDWEGVSYVIQWTARFMDQTDPVFGAVYKFNSKLNVRGYENTEPSPSSDAVSNIRFLDPATGLEVSNWCDLTSVLVMADIEDVGAVTHIVAMVDKHPLGVQLFNDYALQEEDVESFALPDYVIFEELSSPLISMLDSEPTDGTISFLLDISDLSADDRYRIFVQAYRVVT